MKFWTVKLNSYPQKLNLQTKKNYFLIKIWLFYNEESINIQEFGRVLYFYYNDPPSKCNQAKWCLTFLIEREASNKYMRPSGHILWKLGNYQPFWCTLYYNFGLINLEFFRNKLSAQKIKTIFSNLKWHRNPNPSSIQNKILFQWTKQDLYFLYKNIFYSFY